MIVCVWAYKTLKEQSILRKSKVKKPMSKVTVLRHFPPHLPKVAIIYSFSFGTYVRRIPNAIFFVFPAETSKLFF